jgi:hypothetical protein
MGHRLRWSVPVSSSGAQRRHPRTTSDTPQVVSASVPPDSASPVPRSDLPLQPASSVHVLRPRRPLPDALPPTSAKVPRISAKVPSIPTRQRWYYEPVLPSSPPLTVTHDEQLSLRDEVTAFVAALPTSRVAPPIPLQPRQPWMLEGDNRSDVEADLD